MDFEKQIDRIKECAWQIETGKVTILTGKNGSGKSLLRKMLSGAISTKLGTDPSHTVASVSMESRTNKKHEFSALSAMGIDNPENPTSSESLYNIHSLIKSLSNNNKRYLVIDEPEIGMGEEMIAALSIKLNSLLNPLPDGCYGVLIITHNRYLVSNLQAEFINLEGMTKDEWLNREIIPTNLEEFEENASGLYLAIYNRINTAKRK